MTLNGNGTVTLNDGSSDFFTSQNAVSHIQVFGDGGDHAIDGRGLGTGITMDLRGDDGNDTIYGGDDNDSLIGGDGDDRIDGENGGSDSIYGGSGYDLTRSDGSDFETGKGWWF